MKTLAVLMHSARLDIKLEKQRDMYGVGCVFNFYWHKRCIETYLKSLFNGIIWDCFCFV